FVRAVQREERAPFLVQRCGGLRVDLERLRRGLERALRIAAVHPHAGEVDPRLGTRRVDREASLEGLFGALEIAGLPAREAEEVSGVRVAGAARDGDLELRGGIRERSALVRGDAFDPGLDRKSTRLNS